MNLPPRNYLDNAPNSPSTHQVETATHQQGTREAANAMAQVPQGSVALANQANAGQAAQSTARAAADAQLNYTKSVLLDRAGLTQGAQTMANLANTYAPQGGDIATVAQAISQGLRL